MDCSLTNTLPKPKTITVNGKVIPREVIAREVQNHPAEKPILAWQAAARALVVRELLLQESDPARNRGGAALRRRGTLGDRRGGGDAGVDRPRSGDAGAGRSGMSAVLRTEPPTLPVGRPVRGGAYPDRLASGRRRGTHRGSVDGGEHPGGCSSRIQRCSPNSPAAIRPARPRRRRAAGSAS